MSSKLVFTTHRLPLKAYDLQVHSRKRLCHNLNPQQLPYMINHMRNYTG